MTTEKAIVHKRLRRFLRQWSRDEFKDGNIAVSKAVEEFLRAVEREAATESLPDIPSSAA